MQIIMKRILSFAVLSCLMVCAFGQTFSTTRRVNLDNGDSLVFESRFNPYAFKEKRIVAMYSDTILKSPLLSILGIEKYSDEIKESLAVTIQNGYSAYDNSFRGFGFSSELKDFVFRNPRVRDVCFNMGKKLVCSVCKIYAKDYTENMVRFLQSALRYTDEMQGHSFELQQISKSDNNGYSYTEEYILMDGEIFEEYYDQPELYQFLIRRVAINRMTPAEVRDYVKDLLDAVQSIDLSNNADMAFRLVINNEVEYCEGIKDHYYRFIKTNKIFYHSEGSYNNELTNTPLYWWGDHRIISAHQGEESYYKIGAAEGGIQVVFDANGDIITTQTE